MKIRLILFIIASIVCFHCNAKHLEFMGIPIDGTINSFQTKLLAKGCSLAGNNKELPSGVRGFKGIFAGIDSEIIVWYNHRTKEVYQVRAISDCGSSLEQAHHCFLYFKDLLIQKYKEVSLNSDMMEDSSKGEYEFDMVVMEPPIKEGAQAIGIIDVYIIRYDTFPTSYAVCVTYYDLENKHKNEKETLNDL